MAHSLSAKKRIRQSDKRRGRNRWRKEQVKSAVKAVEKAVHDNKGQDADTALKTAYQKLDRVAAKGTIHKNAAARKKSRLAKRINKMKAAAKA